jgi:hypothetical protein
MADFTYGSQAVRSDSRPVGRAPDLRRVVSLMGAALSAALMAGLVWWAWALMQRDVYGVPVVRALEGAMRESPADPGGDEASHQGLAVARVQAEGMAAPPPAELVLAPAAMDLAPEDLPQPALLARRAVPAPAAAATGVVVDDAPRPGPGPAAAAQPQDGPERPDGAVTLAALDPAAPTEPAPAALAAPVAVPEASIASSAIEAALAEALGLSPADMPASPGVEGVIPATIPGVARSPRPAPRPEGDGMDTAPPLDGAPVVLASAAAAPSSGAWLSSPAPGVPSLGEATIAVATGPARVVQLGAFDAPDQAEAEWQRLTAAHADLLGGRDRTVEQAVTNGRTFYRLRAGGFADLADARRFCVALVANGAACIPVPQ